MDWIQVASIIGVNIALFGALATIIIWMVNKIDADVKGLSTRLDGHASRIDQLYMMFVKSQEEFNKKFYELLKEKNK